ncbi:MAG: hypothetical protein DYH20_02155 [Gammaproteobacteria bacterium PRO9]|nr:hypothetical protein [Gammaproteobacteria bacterium PRO9]
MRGPRQWIRRAARRKQVRWQFVLATILLFSFQFVVDSHLIGHAATGHNAGCAICVLTGGSPAAPPPVVNAQPAVSPPVTPDEVAASAPVTAFIVASRRARAPPASLQS